MTAVIQAGLGVGDPAWGTGPANGQNRATGRARAETQANSIRRTFSQTHGKFQFCAASLGGQGKDPQYFGGMGIREDNKLETWPERIK